MDKDDYSTAFDELTAGDVKPVEVDDSPLENPKPKATPEKEAAMAKSAQEAQEFADAWNDGEPKIASKKPVVMAAAAAAKEAC